MKESKKYMIGNLILRDKCLCRVIAIEDGYLYVQYDDGIVGHVSETKVENIPLTDMFFTNNGYLISDEYTDGTRKLKHIISSDGFGPAVTKYTDEIVNGKCEYCIAGIIIRTVDDFQNLMNICGCQQIANKIKVIL